MKKGMIKLADEKNKKIIFNNVKYVPDLAPYIFLIMYSLCNGFNFWNQGETIYLQKDD